ncbi:hypothetical protein M5K25_002559 [Dendrobium thyrsiflorum]|uniref:Uncharacterized protein n=1 Tax=Dendrobium thyrsiflorum TaxID=117978 RepID=A0ABD0VMM6_DENTH
MRWALASSIRTRLWLGEWLLGRSWMNASAINGGYKLKQHAPGDMDITRVARIKKDPILLLLD